MHLVLKAIGFQSASMGGEAEKVFDERGGTFGRSKASDWVLPDPERYISGKHGRIFFEDGRYFVTDTSTNGLVIEGQGAPIGKGNSAPLNHGDILLLGEFRLQVSLEEEESIPVDEGKSVAQEDILQAADGPGTLDPLDLILPDSSESAEAGDTWPETQPDDSPLSHDHFRVPGIGKYDLAPSFEPPPPEPEQPSLEPVIPEAFDESAQPENGDLIGDDWDITEYGRAADALPESEANLDSHTPQESSSTPEAIPAPPPSEVMAPEPAPEPSPDRDALSRISPAPEPSPVAHPGQSRAPERPAVHPGPRDAAPVSDSALFEAFLQGLGVGDVENSYCSEETMRSFGELLQVMIGSLMDLLSSRADFKNEFRLSRTVIKPVENNPLKFSPNTDEALRIFFSPASSGYLGLEDSVRGSLTDLKLHQVGLVAGLQAVFQELSSLMSPERYTADSAEGVKAFLQSITQKSRNWDRFCAYCERLDRESSSGIAGHFSDVFADAYEERILMLSENDRGSS